MQKLLSNGKIWGNFLTLLFRPGQLTRDDWAGRYGLSQAGGPFGMKILARGGPSGTELTIGVRALTIRLNRSLAAEHIAQLNQKIHKFYKVIQ